MLSFILESYLSLFLSVGIASLCVFLLGLYWIFRHDSNHSISTINADLSPIAGDDVFATQLDLARAYLETNNKHLAKPILHLVVERGSKIQISEAKSLLNLI